MKKHQSWLILIWLLILIILPLPLVGLLDFGLIDTPNNLLAYDLGIFAYVWWLADIYLATRPQWLEKKISLPSNYLLHGLLAVFALIAASLHKFLATSYHASIRNTGNAAWYLEIGLMVLAILFLSGWLTDRFSWTQNLKAKLPVKHQVAVWLHVNLIPRLSNAAFFIPVFDLYTVIFLASYFYKKLVRDADQRQEATLVENKALTSQVQRLSLKLPADKNQAQAGDFYFLSFTGKGQSHEAHPFSVASQPQSGQLDFLIHKVGDFTQQIDQYQVDS